MERIKHDKYKYKTVSLFAGIGGFAVLWFAVKKKTFADLGVALKKGFTAIGNFFKNLGAKIKALFTKKK